MMKEYRRLTDAALSVAQVCGASYADVRITRQSVERISVKNGIISASLQHESRGFGVRTIVDGAWGFAGSALLSRQEVERVAALSVRVARASAMYRIHDIDLGTPVTETGFYRTPVSIDPAEISLDRKVELLLNADREMRTHPQVMMATSSLGFFKESKIFANTEGAFLVQEIQFSGGGIEALARDPSSGEIQKRSYPNSFGRDWHSKGWEAILEMRLPEKAQQIGAEAVALLTARQCPNIVTSLILGPAQMAIQIHETCGHAVELDRVLGSEAGYAGTSFLTPDKLGVFEYGSEVVNITADATMPGGLGTFGWDDEGIRAQRVPIIREGKFIGCLTSRETARQLEKITGSSLPIEPGGMLRASSWNRTPLIRMTNINLEPGSWEFDALVTDTENGIYMELNKSWSIDDRRLNFHFGVETAYEIKNGKLGQLFKNAVYAGLTPQFWASCDAVCNQNYWRMCGTPNCSKGQPSQTIHIGHGASPARFRNVHVGAAR